MRFMVSRDITYDLKPMCTVYLRPTATSVPTLSGLSYGIIVKQSCYEV